MLHPCHRRKRPHASFASTRQACLVRKGRVAGPQTTTPRATTSPTPSSCAPWQCSSPHSLAQPPSGHLTSFSSRSASSTRYLPPCGYRRRRRTPRTPHDGRSYPLQPRFVLRPTSSSATAATSRLGCIPTDMTSRRSPLALHRSRALRALRRTQWMLRAHRDV